MEPLCDKHDTAVPMKRVGQEIKHTRTGVTLKDPYQCERCARVFDSGVGYAFGDENPKTYGVCHKQEVPQQMAVIALGIEWTLGCLECGWTKTIPAPIQGI